jgi:hypothetical protein
VEQAAVAAADGALKGAGEISASAVAQVHDAVTSAIGGVKVVLREPSRGEAGGNEPRAG